MHIGRYIPNRYQGALIVIIDRCLDHPGWSIQQHLILGVVEHTYLGKGPDNTHGTMAAHVQIAATVHEHNTEVGLGDSRWENDGAKHILVAPGFVKEGCAQVVEVFLESQFRLNHTLNPDHGEARRHHPCRFASGMSIYCIDASIIAHISLPPAG